MKRTNTAKWMEKQQRWQINVQKDGVRKSFYSGTPGRTGQREANKKADLWLDEGVENQKIKVCDAYEKYLAEVQRETSAQNYRNKKQRWECYIKPIIGVRTVATIGDSDIQAILDSAFAARKLAKKTLKNIKEDLSSFIKYCRREKMTYYFIDNVTIPSAAQVRGKKIFSPDDLKVLFSSDKSTFCDKVVTDRYIYAYRFHVLTGLRPGEIIGIKPEDYAPGYVYIRRSVNIDNQITNGKNKNAIRTVALSQRAEEVIQEQMRVYPDCEYVFNISNEKHYYKMLRRYCAYNGIQIISPYSLRHTFVSVAKKLPEGMVKKVVGHSEDMDTFGVYSKYFDGEDKEIAAAVGVPFEEILTGKK